MNDFTIRNCPICKVDRMQLNFSWCRDCERSACAHTDLNCGIHCPCCSWFVCADCVIKHSKTCWEKDDEIQIKITDKGTVYSFFQEEKANLSDRITVFSNEEGGIVQIIIN